MSELTPLREAVETLAGGALPPDFGDLKRRATRRGRRRVATVTIATAAVVVGSAVAFTGLDSDRRTDPVDQPSPSHTSVQGSDDPTTTSFAALGEELDGLVEDVPGWAISDAFPAGYDYAFNGPCSGDWTSGGISGGDGGIGRAGLGGAGFTSIAQAKDAAATFVENLASCTATAWRTQSIAGTGAVLASSASGVAWIQQRGRDVKVLQVPTADGPPPTNVQVEVAQWLTAYMLLKSEQIR